MNGQPLPIAPEIRDAATHGQFCPKMCTFACPVARATGLDEAVPWNFHREVADLAAGWSDTASAWERLSLCNGCHACRSACTYEQDVPAQVVAGRTALVAAGRVPAHVAAAVARITAEGSPGADDASALPPGDEAATTVLVLGPEDPVEVGQQLATLAARAGVSVRFVGGRAVVGGLLTALGHTDLAATADASLVTELVGAATAVVVDPDVQTTVETAADPNVRVVDLPTWLLSLLESGNLVRTSAPALGSVTWHDPDSLARTHAIHAPPRQVLRLLGGVIVEPEGMGAKAVSAGPGLAMHHLAPEATAAVAAARGAQLAATGAPTVTLGGATIDALRSTGLEVRHLVDIVLERTQGRAAPKPTPPDNPTNQDPEQP